MDSAVIGDAKVSYRLAGDAGKPWLVLGNSLGADHRMWDSQIPDWQHRFHIVCYDARGHGASGLGSGPADVAQLAGDVIGLMDRLDIRRSHFCGLSLGGAIGMHLATHFPDRIGRLVLANTGARIGEPPMWEARAQKVAREGVESIADAVLSRWFSDGFRIASPAVVSAAREMMLATDRMGYVQACLALRDMDQRQSIAAISAPTLVIAGTQDVATPPDDARYLVSRIPGSHLVELEAAHLTNIEQPAAFSRAVLDFLCGS